MTFRVRGRVIRLNEGRYRSKAILFTEAIIAGRDVIILRISIRKTDGSRQKGCRRGCPNVSRVSR